MMDNIRLPKEMDLLLVIPPPFFMKMPHIGVAYLSAFLKQNGLRPATYDLSIKLYNQASPELKKFWNIDCINSFFVSEIAEKIFTNFEEEIDEFIDDILATETRVIGFSVNITSIYLASRMAKIIKARDPRRLIIFGGPGTYFKHPRELIQPASADIYVIGEG